MRLGGELLASPVGGLLELAGEVLVVMTLQVTMATASMACRVAQTAEMEVGGPTGTKVPGVRES
jgi:hypothetical protein